MTETTELIKKMTAEEMLDPKVVTLKALRKAAKEEGFKKTSKMGRKLLVEALTHKEPAQSSYTPKPSAPVNTPKKKTTRRRSPVKETVGGIDKDVPLPAVQSKAKYPIEDLAPGESFLVAGPKKDLRKLYARLNGAKRRVEKKTKRTFFVAIVEEESGVRCWRTDVVQTAAKKKAPAVKPASKPAPVSDAVKDVAEPIPLTDEVEDDAPACDPAGPAPVAAPEVQSFKIDL